MPKHNEYTYNCPALERAGYHYLDMERGAEICLKRCPFPDKCVLEIRGKRIISTLRETRVRNGSR